MKLIVKSTFALILFFTLTITVGIAQTEVAKAIDSLLVIKTDKPFNGVVMISQNGKVNYSKHIGYSDYDQKIPLKMDDQFILGSISKQFTAVLVLRELDKGRLKIQDTLRKYLPDLKDSWVDSITIHQLLNHTSGIVELNKPLAFVPGSKFSYSPTLAYSLLQLIIEKTSGKSYDILAEELFKKCKMKNTTTPAFYINGNLTVNFIQNKKGILKRQNTNLKEAKDWTAGAGIITTAKDLTLWNSCLHEGKILSVSSYKMMITPSAQRQHPLWGNIGYGYGIQIDSVNGILELGHGGYFDGFNNISFYYPKTKTSVVVLSNVDWFDKSFFYQMYIMDIIRKSRLIQKD